jgi:putative hydrolases of HD superfamily
MSQQPRPTTANIDAASDQELDETVKLAHELGQLKMLPRTGWLRAGIEHPARVAEHSLRAAMLAWMLAGAGGRRPGARGHAGAMARLPGDPHDRP